MPEYSLGVKHGLATLRTNPSGDILQHDNITVAAIGKCSRAAFQFQIGSANTSFNFRAELSRSVLAHIKRKCKA